MDPGPDEEGSAERALAVHRQNLDAFGGRAARLCSLMRHGRLSPERCFVAVSQLWVQVVRSERRTSRGAGDGPEAGGAGAERGDARCDGDLG